jgi:aminoglycoside phosphotransferase (APT) family kinase protein
MIDSDLAAWAAAALGSDEPLLEARGLRVGGSPWLVRAARSDGSGAEAVLRVGPAGGSDDILTEANALAAARAAGLPAPRVYAIRDDTEPALLLIERVAGSSRVPMERPTARLRQLGSFAAHLHKTAPPAGAHRRTRSIPGVDFAALRRAAEPIPVLQRAEAAVSGYTPGGADGFVHGDFWQGNTMWDVDRLVAVIDWDCAGVGPAGIDLGSMRLDAVTAFGIDASDDVLAGWQEVGGAAPDLAYCDVVAGLATPPDLDWFVDTIVAQGRPDLTHDLLRARRDEFLENALARMG